MRRRKWIVLLLVSAVLFWSQLGIPGVNTSVRISSETTHITEPLDKDGYVDYAAALNRLNRRGVTPANNAVVPIAQALGPGSRGPGSRQEEFFRQLGIPVPPSDGDYFVPYEEFLTRHIKPNESPRKDIEEKRWQELRRAMVHPWPADEHPGLAEWLQENGEPLDLLIEASRRSRWFAPVRCDLTLLAQTLLVSDLRDPGRALCMRAMLKLGNKDIDGACDDVIACRRLGRLMRQGPLVMNLLVGNMFEMFGVRAEAALVHYAQPSPHVLQTFAESFKNLPPPRSLVELLDVGERFVLLDSCIATARGQDTPEMNPIQGAVLRWGIDWNSILRQANASLDLVVDAAETRGPTARIETVRQTLSNIDRRVEQQSNGWRGIISMLTRGGRSRRIGGLLVSLMLPKADLFAAAIDRNDIHVELAEMMPALAAYRTEHGEYPETLEALMPEYVDALPPDPHAAGPYRYRRTDKGCLIYSVGANGRDDNGRNRALELDNTASEDADDIFLALPPKTDGAPGDSAADTGKG